MLTTEQMEKLARWQALQTQLKELQPQEIALRKELAEMLVPNQMPGQHKFPIANGYSAKVVLKETASLDKNAFEKLPTVYAELMEAGLEAEEAAALIKVDHSLVTGAYNKLSAKMQRIMSAVVTTKLAAPTIEINKD